MPVNSHAAPTPFDEALIIINADVGTDHSIALAKLILSLHNKHFAFSMHEILLPLNHHHTRLALRLVADYGHFGETRALQAAGKLLLNDPRFNHLIELANAIGETKTRLANPQRRRLARSIVEACHG